MAIPDFQTIMLPLLRVLKDGKEHNIGEVVYSLAEGFELSGEERPGASSTLSRRGEPQ